MSILNVTRYATQVNRQHIKIVMNTAEKDTPGCYNILQHHTFTVHQLELRADCTLCLLHSSKSQRFPILYERSCHAYNGLCWCSHNQNTLTSCTTCRESQNNAITHCRNTTFNYALTNFIRRCTSLLQIPMHPHLDCR